MSAAEIADALGDARREGRSWRCRCPLHDGRSLVLTDGHSGQVLATCWGGCDRLDVLAELRGRGLLDDRATNYRRSAAPPPRRHGAASDAARTQRALDIWHKARPARGTIVEAYLRTRGITLDPWPLTLRFHPQCPRPKDDAGNFVPPLPAMVALFERVDRGPVAIHATYLRPDGKAKAELPKNKQKASFGPVGGGAVRLGAARQGERLAIAEGIETALSVATACMMPAWAALSDVGIKKLILPPEATHIVICADHDASGVGQRAAREAAERWITEGRHVRIAMPPRPGQDFNDILRGDPLTITEGRRHVAA